MDRDEANEARIRNILAEVTRLLTDHDLAGIGIVTVDSRSEVRTMYTFSGDAHYSMIAGAHILDRKLVNSVPQLQTLAHMKTVGSG